MDRGLNLPDRKNIIGKGGDKHDRSPLGGSADVLFFRRLF
jgi:hypothetical protein